MASAAALANRKLAANPRHPLANTKSSGDVKGGGGGGGVGVPGGGAGGVVGSAVVGNGSGRHHLNNTQLIQRATVHYVSNSCLTHRCLTAKLRGSH